MTSIRAARINIQKLPTRCIYVPRADLRTEIISLFSVNGLIFITEKVFTVRYELDLVNDRL
jgi:hypothetical protein